MGPYMGVFWALKWAFFRVAVRCLIPDYTIIYAQSTRVDPCLSILSRPTNHIVFYTGVDQ